MKQFLFVVFAMAGLSASAQDVIVKRNGDEIQAKVAKISDSEIEYKKWSNQNGPSYTIKASEVFMIKYENGEKDVFDAAPEKAGAKSGDIMGNAALSADELLSLVKSYQPELGFESGAEELNGKKAGGAMFQLCPSANSVLADKNVEMIFLNSCRNAPVLNMKYGLDYGMDVIVRNKSDKTIYLDLGNTFFIRDSKSEAYYVPQAFSNSHTTSSGVSVNVGAVAGAVGVGGALGSALNGVNVGNGSSYTSQVITFSQRVVAIPPLSAQSLGIKQYFTKEMCAGTRARRGAPQGPKGVGALSVVSFQESNAAGSCPVLKSINLKLGDIKQYEESNSLMTFGVFVTYSDSEDLASCNKLKATFYVNKVLPVKQYSSWVTFSSVPNIENVKCLSGDANKSLFFACPFK